MQDEQLEIIHDRTASGGRYWAAVAGGEAELTYRQDSAARIIIDHTYTPPQARGKNIARRLVERAAADARAGGVKIVPQCPYVDKLFQRRADLDDLRALR